MSAERLPNFIIGGTEKAGTTSVFTYLSQHPEVCASREKELEFFRSAGGSAADYAKHFAHCPADAKIVMEASTAYLGEAAEVAPRMAAIVPDVKLLFILREPASRLFSSFNFHKSRLNIPSDMPFADYVEQSLAFHKGKLNGSRQIADDWQYGVLGLGRYADSLTHIYEHLPRHNVKVMFFEQLKADTAGFMDELSDFLGIGKEPWQGFEFHKENVTIRPRNEFIQRMALWLNDRGESVLRRNPAMKRKLVGIYKSFNQRRTTHAGIPDATGEELQAFYAPANASLREMLGCELPEEWR